MRAGLSRLRGCGGALDGATRTAVLREACRVAASGEAGARSLTTAIEDDAETAARVGAVLNAARCL